MIGLTAFDKAWTLLKATVQEMRTYEPTDEQMDRYYNWGTTIDTRSGSGFPTQPRGYTLTPEDKEKHKEALQEFQDDLGNEARYQYDHYNNYDYNPPVSLFRNLAIKYGTPRIGPIQNPEDRHLRVVQDVLREMERRDNSVSIR